MDEEAHEDELVGQDVISGTIRWWESLSRADQDRHLAWIHEQMHLLDPAIASLFQVLRDRVASYPEKKRKPWYTLDESRERGLLFLDEEQEIRRIIAEGLACA